MFDGSLKQENTALRTGSPKNSACLFGCGIFAAIAFVLSILMILAALSLYRMGSGFIKAKADQFTDTAPLALPKVHLTSEQSNALFNRIDEFKAALEGKSTMRTLRLSADEVNAFLAYQPQLQPLSKYVYFTINGNTVGGTLSFPLNQLPLPPALGLKDRFLNGSGDFAVLFQGGELRVSIMELFVKGQRLPEDFIAPLRNENFALEFTQDPNIQRVLNRLQNIEVSNSELILTLKEGV